MALKTGLTTTPPPATPSETTPPGLEVQPQEEANIFLLLGPLVLYRRLEAEATARGMTVALLIAKAIDAYLKK